MDTVISQQTLVFLQAAALGLCLGFVYDCLRVLRRTARLRRVGTAVCDGVFCVVCLLAVALFLLLFGHGQLRGYIPLGAVLGVALYLCGLSDWVRALLRPLFGLVGRAARGLGRAMVAALSFPRGH